MCFGKSKSSSPPPAPTVTAQPSPNNVPDVSAQQKMAALTEGTTSRQAAFGSELGTPAPAMAGAR